MSGVNVRVKGVLYPISQLIGKTIYANGTTPLYPYIGGKALFQINAGGVIGQMYSWNTAADGTVYLTFYTTSTTIKAKYPNGYYIVKLSDVNGSSLKEQGAKTTEQVAEEEKKAAEEANKTFSDKALDTVKNIALWGIGIYAVTSIVKSKI